MIEQRDPSAGGTGDPAGGGPAGPAGATGTRPGPAMSWALEHQVLLGGLALILAQVIWKVQDLRHLYFFQDDYVNLDRAAEFPLNWHYLTLVSSGHFFPGLRVITWILARHSLYDWGLDSAVLVGFLICASLAAFRVLRTLFGDRPVILIPLGIYLLTPLTVPGLGWWWSGMESVPFQLAIFMMLNAHVYYIRTGRTRHLVAASFWLIFGLAFFEKAAVLPLLMFAITAAYFIGTRSWLAGAASTLVRYWRAWASYLALTLGYGIVFIIALQASATSPTAPNSAGTAVKFAWTLVRTTFFTGAIGGPWHWFATPGGLYAVASPPAIAVWLAAVINILVVAVSIVLRGRSWRAWAILAGWLVLADMIPVLLGRLQDGLAGLFGLETRYLADAACVLAICVGLAFLPVAGTSQGAEAGPGRRRLPVTGPQLRYAAAGLVGIFVFGSILSVQAYEKTTPGAPVPRAYMANAEHAIATVRRDTNVINLDMPPNMVTGVFEKNALQSKVLGDLDPGQLRWLTNPQGTYDDLQIFGSDGGMFPAVISGVSSVRRTEPGFKSCWPQRHEHITVRFTGPTSSLDTTLKLTYIWGGPAGTVLVEYGGHEEQLTLRHGVHAAYLPVTGSVRRFIVSGFGRTHLCIATASAGQLVPF